MIFVQVRYRYRLYPTQAQQRALARAFGYARIVFNDCLWLQESPARAGQDAKSLCAHLYGRRAAASRAARAVGALTGGVP